MLNVDYKIVSKAITLCLSKVMSVLVDLDQTCSVPGRSISSNLILLCNVLDFIEHTNEAGILVNLNQEKAFDRVNHTFLLNLLEHFGSHPIFLCGLGPSTVALTWVLYLMGGLPIKFFFDEVFDKEILFLLCYTFYVLRFLHYKLEMIRVSKAFSFLVLKILVSRSVIMQMIQPPL